MTRSLFYAFLLFALSGLTAGQQQSNRPNLSGHWVMNPARSRFPTFKGKTDPGADEEGFHINKCCIPKSHSEIIDHKEPSLNLTMDTIEVDDEGKEYPSQDIWKTTTDGHESTNEMSGHKYTCKSHWEEDKLVTTAAGDG